MKLRVASVVFSFFLFLQFTCADRLSESDESSLSSSSTEDEEDCPRDFFRSRYGCRQCTVCGPKLYEKKSCQPEADTVCDWCLTEEPTLNEDFFESCEEYRKGAAAAWSDKFQAELREELKSLLDEMTEEERQSSVTANCVGFALAFLIMLVPSVLLGCCVYRLRSRAYTRVISVTPPELNEVDQHNIIFAAKQIRDKLSKKHGTQYEFL